MDSGPGNTGSDANAGNNDPDPMDAGKDSGSPDVPCTPMYGGCEDKYPDADPATLCGEIDNGCGVMIQCDPAGMNCSGVSMRCNDPTKPNQCGCAPSTCENVVAGGADCGVGIDDGCGATVDCGTCPGSQDICSEQLVCECVPSNAACEGKICGSSSDGCSGTVECGQLEGACAQGTCSSDQTQCTCPLRDIACNGRPNGPLTINGCDYICGVCVTDGPTLCGDAECGSVIDQCGNPYNCGPNAGGCASGQTCVDPVYAAGKSYVEGETSKVCLDDDLANLIGTYSVRTHAFRKTVSIGLSLYQRSEALSLVRITLKGAERKPHMIDYGCAATSLSPGIPGTFVSATSNAPYYENIAPAEIDLAVEGNETGTGGWERPVIKTVVSETLTTQGVPTGILLKMPSFCTPSAGAMGNVVTPTDGLPRPWLSGYQAGMSAGQCVCPVDDAAAATMPASAVALSQDCRVFDADADGKPGFTVDANGTGVDADVYNVTISGVTWRGAIRADGFHTGVAIEPLATETTQGIQRSVVGCTGTGCNNVVGAPSSDCACGDQGQGQYNFVQFVPLDGLSKAVDTWTCADVRTNANGGEFNLFRQGFGTCTGTAHDPAFPVGTVCRSERFYPATSTTSCSTNGTTTVCPTGMDCRTGTCAPKASECPSEVMNVCPNPT